MKALKEMDKRREAATKGPWHSDGHYVWEGKDSGDLEGMLSDYPSEVTVVTRARGTGRGLSYEQQKANMDYIAHSITDHERMSRALRFLYEEFVLHEQTPEHNVVRNHLRAILEGKQ